MTALASLDEWTRGVLFPLVVLGVAACAAWSARCLTRIMGEFQETRRDVARITKALHDAGLLDDDD